MDKVKIEINRKDSLNYNLIVKGKKSGVPYCFRNVYGEKIDNKYLLRKDLSGEADKIFGISDTPEETEKRLYATVLEMTNIEKDFYSGLNCQIEIINNTPQSNQLELKLKLSN